MSIKLGEKLLREIFSLNYKLRRKQYGRFRVVRRCRFFRPRIFYFREKISDCFALFLSARMPPVRRYAQIPERFVYKPDRRFESRYRSFWFCHASFVRSRKPAQIEKHTPDFPPVFLRNQFQHILVPAAKERALLQNTVFFQREPATSPRPLPERQIRKFFRLPKASTPKKARLRLRRELRQLRNLSLAARKIFSPPRATFPLSKKLFPLRYMPIIFFVLLPPPKPVLKTSQRKKIPARRKHRGADVRKSKKYANGF